MSDENQQKPIILTIGGKPLTPGWSVTFRGDLDDINAYINAGCPEPTYKSGCPILSEDDAR